jgi:anaerobic ribonucleoside-triphosphate reductase
MENKIEKVQKRDGSIVPFDQNRITEAIFKALTATGEGDRKKAQKLSNRVVQILNRRFKKGEIPNIEQIQDIVEEVLILEGLVKTAKAYILYREQRRRIREAIKVSEEAVDRLDQYIEKLDWEVQENANMAFSLQGLNHYGVTYIIKKYWLNKIYPPEIREAHESGDFHIHNLDTLGPYCMGWDLYDLLVKGFGGVPGKIESKPPKHFNTALMQCVNFLYTLQGECYSEDTQVLTENGWKYFYEVKKGEKVFTLNPKTNKIELQEPYRFYEYDFEGELYNFKSKKVDLLVTPGHRMLVDQYSPYSKEKYRKKFVEAKNFNPNTQFIPKGGDWEGKEEKYFILPAIQIFQIRNYRQIPFAKNLAFLPNASEVFGEVLLIGNLKIKTSQPKFRHQLVEIPEKKILMDDWLKFFGFWLAEGCTTLRKRKRKGWKNPHYEYQVRISQNEGKSAKEFEKVLKRLPFNYTKKKSGKKIEFVILNKQLFLYLKQFGKREEKFIPKEIKNLSKRQLKILFDWMMKGDGYIGNGNIDYYTKSKKLADDVQEIALKLGWSANIYEKRKGKSKWYRVAISKTKHFKFKKENIRKVKYKGKVYCLEVPNHTLYVRRNGKALWCGNCAGAVSFSNFDTLLAPFIRYDNLNYQQVKQALQEFLFNMAIPTRVGFQTPFSNITLDLKPSPVYAKMPVIIGGKPQDKTYSEFKEEMKIFNKALYEVYMEGDAKGRPFHFPIPTINITKDFPWDEPAFDGIFEASAKYGTNYFANYINSEMKPEDVRSMCCRLRLDLTELYNRGGGGLFGAGSKTGSIGVVTINLPRIGYLSKTKKEFFERLARVMDLAKESLEIKRKVLENFIEKGLYPYSRYYLQDIKRMRGKYWANHFSTIGLVGMNECLLNFMGENIASKRGRKFTLEVLDFMRERLVKYQRETGNIYNLEATPAESTAYRLALKDKERYPDIITAGTKKVPYYTNSTQLPVNYTDDIFEALKLQDEIQCKYTGGTVLHIFLGERMQSGEGVKKLVKKIFENFKLPYITITPTFSICPVHGYIPGEHFFCPKCTIKQPCEVYSRIVGYYRPVQHWNLGKQQEFKQRKEFKIKESTLK